MRRTLCVRNEVQAALWTNELSGQISDGHWENARPFDHWKSWSDAEVLVYPKDVGRNFAARRDSYAFDHPDLLGVVGGRMLAYGRLARAFGWRQVELLDGLLDLQGSFRGLPEYEGEYWDGLRRELGFVDVEKVRAVVEDVNLYTWEELLSDLRDLKRIVKIRREVR